MVKKEVLVHLFLGEDISSKNIKLKRLKEEFLNQDTEYFNLDILYAKELNLAGLQERLLCLPIKAKKRIILIKDSQDLEGNIKEFILRYAKKPQEKKTILILEVNKYSPRDEFVRQLIRYAEVSRFKESPRLDTFVLSRSIDAKKISYALWLLKQLLRNGEKPERILGGLRYASENSIFSALEARRRLRLLLNCDIDIKTGRLRPIFALEKLVVGLCCFVQSSG